MELSSTERRMFQADSTTETEVEKHRIYPDKFAAHCVRLELFREAYVSHSVISLCNPIDCSPPSSSVHGIHQARILVWVAIPLSSPKFRPETRIGFIELILE